VRIWLSRLKLAVDRTASQSSRGARVLGGGAEDLYGSGERQVEVSDFTESREKTIPVQAMGGGRGGKADAGLGVSIEHKRAATTNPAYPQVLHQI